MACPPEPNKGFFMDRKAFKFYRSYYDVALELPDKDRLEFLMALLEIQFTGSHRQLKGMSKFAFISQKHSIDAQIEGYLTKTGATLPPTQGASQQEKEKEQVQEKEQEKYNADKSATIDDRKKLLMKKMVIHLPEYGKEMLREFFDYWTEMNEGGKKMRFEMQKVFQVDRRLKTWSRNNKFKSNGGTIEQITSAQQKRNAIIAAKFANQSAGSATVNGSNL